MLKTPTLIACTCARGTTVSQSENRARVILSPSEGSAFLPYSCRIGVGDPKLTLRHNLLRRKKQTGSPARSSPLYPEFRLRLSEKTQVDDFGRRDFPRYF